MNNFDFKIPTDIRFGKGKIDCLQEELSKYGKRVLLTYGGGSIKKNGIYDEVLKQLADFEVYELGGITPNPKLSIVEKGTTICKENHIDVILAVGGGSTIDASKHIAAAACYEGNPWDLVLDRSLVKSALPIAVVLTICATGSEMNSGAVITNENTCEKLEINTPLLYPKLSVCDPTYLYTLPKKQTAAGVIDIMSHVMEQYFQPNDEAYITDALSEAVMKTVIRYGRKAIDEPENYEARSNLMWASTIGLNHLLTVGKGGAWSVHPIEHVLSGFYDVTHGIGLAILTPAWMEYVLNDATKHRFARFARTIFNVKKLDDTLAAKEGIECLKEYFKSIGMPLTLTEIGIDNSKFQVMASEAVRTSNISKNSYVKLEEEDIIAILNKCA
ncbi:MAG: iron-containing alcohol dehydrogenase [Pseudobutyrivibrio ruminis]|uniref:iron-containing alcohol dehydrogenase n=1 Tax=Pseudobutyrivibrio ruminis TaxID=46206 RepID=UPI0026EC5DB5|nr:iron-containing alcohol dehydrogenase [Pseudobutyrivibrio ruminis]MBE5914023.1 iron-containing alcohol dehydrogenase [Pseudobutyrivibrio ruminis]